VSSHERSQRRNLLCIRDGNERDSFVRLISPCGVSRAGKFLNLHPHTPPATPHLFQQLSEANMTVTNVIEVVVALALLYAAYRFFQKRA